MRHQYRAVAYRVGREGNLAGVAQLGSSGCPE